MIDTPHKPAWLRDEAAIAGRLLLIGLTGVFAIWLVGHVKVVAVAAFLGFAQTALLWPLVTRLRRFLPAALAAIVAVAVYVAALVALLWFITVELINAGPSLLSSALGAADTLNDWFLERGWSIPQGVVDDLQSQAQARLGDAVAGVGSAAVGGLNLASTVATLLVVSTFATLFALTSGDALWASIVRAIPKSRRQESDAAMRASFVTARWWMWASTVTGLIDGVFIGLGLHLLGVPLAVPLGLLTFILGYIPMVGATMAGGLAVAVALFFGGPNTALAALLVVLLVQQVEGNVLSPLLMSRAMNFHPIITLLLATGGGLAFGLMGLFLAVPVSGIITSAVKAWRGVGAGPDDRSDDVPTPATPAATPETS